jgi:hypothetical protein
MYVYNTDCYMPLEMLDLIAAVDTKTYRAMLAIPRVARSLTPGKVVDFMIAFGYSVVITKDHIEWYLNGKRHRDHGPAVEHANGDKVWYLNGELHRQARHRLKLDSKCDPDGPAIECTNGDKVWYLNGKRHRSPVGPAVELANGYKAWYLNGELHRVGGPALEHANGNKGWYLNGKLHRDDGPAVEYEDGNKV